MNVIFWCAFAAVFYVYIGYPMALAVAARLFGKPVRRAQWEPAVSIVVVAHNERHRIEKRIQNCFSLSYPREKLEVIVAVDGSTDGTDSIVQSYASQGVIAVCSLEHLGKASMLNRAMRVAHGDIVVFADARQTFERNTIRSLAGNFADMNVGAVSGELVLLDESRSESKSDMGLYWRYEKWIRSMESRIHSVVGATGAIYAIRRDLYRDLPEDTILDDVLTPMRVAMSGRRVVFEPGAKAYDAVACCPRAEFGRKVRTLMGNYQLLGRVPELWSPWRNPIFFQFFSHKAGRLVAPYLLIALFVSNSFLHGTLYTSFLLAQCAWYLCAVAGHFLMMRSIEIPPSVLMAVPEERERIA